MRFKEHLDESSHTLQAALTVLRKSVCPLPDFLYICTHMFQAIKLILVLDKDNQRKYKMQYLNYVFIYYDTKVIPTYLAIFVWP